MKTKMLVATAVLATAIATPALAQTATPRPQTNPSQLDHHNGQMGPTRSTNRSYDVYQNASMSAPIRIRTSGCSCGANSKASSGDARQAYLEKRKAPVLPGPF